MERDKLNKTISKKPTGVFYLDANKAFYFEQALTSPIPLDIPADTISNFELLNKKKLVVLIQTFIRSYKLVPKNITILLSLQGTFDREFPHGSIEMQKSIQEFLELVPFEELLQRKIVMSGKTRVVATNKEICEAIKSTFVGSGFLVSGIYPLSLSMEIIPELKSNLDLSLFVNKISDLKTINLQPIVEASYSASFEGESSSVGSIVSSSPIEKEKPSRTRLYALSGVFVVLILALVYVIYTTIISPPDKKPANALPAPSIKPVQQNVTNEIVPANPSPINVNSATENVSTQSSTTGLP